MPGTVAPLDDRLLEERVLALGATIRQRRKALGVSAQVAAEAANLSRVTWHRIEAGATTVTIAAWFNALSVLGLAFHLGEDMAEQAAIEGSIPVRIPLARFPQLMALAWQVTGTDTISPREAHDVYERNDRHVDWESMTDRERALVDALREVFDKGAGGV